MAENLASQSNFMHRDWSVMLMAYLSMITSSTQSLDEVLLGANGKHMNLGEQNLVHRREVVHCACLCPKPMDA